MTVFGQSEIYGQFDCRTVTVDGVNGAIAQCASDEFLLTGGGQCETSNPGCGICACARTGYLHYSAPTGNEWTADCYNPAGGDVCVRAYAVCCKK